MADQEVAEQQAQVQTDNGKSPEFTFEINREIQNGDITDTDMQRDLFSETNINTKSESQVQEPSKQEIKVDLNLNNNDFYSTLKDRFGREIDEDYLKNDYRFKYAELENKYNSEAKNTELYKNEAVSALVDYISKGGNAFDFFNAQVINPDSLSEDELIKSFVDRNNPEYDDLIKSVELRQKYAYGVDLDTEIAEAKENNDEDRLYQLAQVKKNRIDAAKEQKEYIKNQKVELLSKSNTNTEEIQKEYERKLGDYAEFAQKELSNIRELKIGDFNLGKQKADVSNLLYKDDESKLLYVNGITDRELIEAIFIYRNKDAIFKSISSALNVKAEVENDRAYNNPVSTQVIPQKSSSDGFRFKILN